MDLLSISLMITAGLLLVFAGRKFFWLATGMIVFIFAFGIFQKSFNAGWPGIVLAVALGVLCAWLAILIIRSFSYFIGAVAGAAGLPIVLGRFGVQWEWWLMALVGLLIGILLVKLTFNWGLILMTVWVGAYSLASMISAWLALNNRITLGIFVGFLALGIFVQAAQLRRKV
jgi:hypothetical protein